MPNIFSIKLEPNNIFSNKSTICCTNTYYTFLELNPDILSLYLELGHRATSYYASLNIKIKFCLRFKVV